MIELIKVLRFKFAKDWTISKYLVNKILTGFGVEDELREVKVHGETAIKAGVYPLGYRQSPKFSSFFYWNDKTNVLIKKETFQKIASTPQAKDYRPHDLIWIKNVVTHDLVLIHWGNTDDDTDGCYIVGSAIGVVNGQEGVTGSKDNYIAMYQKVYPVLKANPTITYSITFENEVH